VPVLAELFTSEGCSSSPPADRILELLARDPPIDGVDVIIMSEHVTYWDHQGWRDPFGSSAFTARQQIYGALFKLQSVFTPQLVIGTDRVIGLDIAMIPRSHSRARSKPKPQLTLELRDNGPHGLVASGQGRPRGCRRSRAGMAITEDNLQLSRRENARRTLHHAALSAGSAAARLATAPAPFQIRSALNGNAIACACRGLSSQRGRREAS
jgi:hypothetical protein